MPVRWIEASEVPAPRARNSAYLESQEWKTVLAELRKNPQMNGRAIEVTPPKHSRNPAHSFRELLKREIAAAKWNLATFTRGGKLYIVSASKAAAVASAKK